MSLTTIENQTLPPAPLLNVPEQLPEQLIDVIAEEVLRPTTQRDLRSLAFHFIYAVDRFDYGITLEEIVENFRLAYNLEISDDSFALKLARGAIDNRIALDEEIKPLLKNWTFERLGVCTRLILRIALWEIDQKEVAPSIAINEAIELAKAFAERDSYKFVNGLLDELCKVKCIKTESEIEIDRIINED